MSGNTHFSGASHYFILEGDARIMSNLLGPKDPLFEERIKLKENLLNEFVIRIADADLKITLLLEIKEKHEEEKRKYLSAEVSLECSLLDDAIKTNLLEMAEILAEFLSRLRTKIPAQCHLFRRSEKILAKANERTREAYSQSRSFLFPEMGIKSNEKVKDSYVHSIADRLQATGDPILRFRDKILAHKYDEERFITYLSFEQYCEIRDSFKRTLDAVAVVGTLSSNNWCMTRSPIEIERTIKWLTGGLMTAAQPIRRNANIEPVQCS